jgi:hypothetical protein
MRTGYVYKLVSNDIEVTECYVGTTENMRVRKNQHKSSCNKVDGKHYNLHVYQFIREHGGFENWQMILVETVEFETRPQLRARERHWMEQLGATLNKLVPNRTSREYRQENADHIKQYNKQYRQENADHIKQYNKQYRQENADHIKQKNKQYYQENAEYFKQYNKQYHKQYYQDNATQIKQYNSKKINCSYCDCTFTQGNKARHIKSKTHIANYKQAYLDCWDEEFTGTLTSEDY